MSLVKFRCQSSVWPCFMFAMSHLINEKGRIVNIFVLPVWLLMWGKVIHVYRLLQDQTGVSVWSSRWKLSIPCRENTKIRYLANFWKLTPFSPYFLSPTPILQQNWKQSCLLLQAPPYAWGMCTFLHFLHFPSTCQFPELFHFEQGRCKSLLYFSFGVSMESGLSSIVGGWFQAMPSSCVLSGWLQKPEDIPVLGSGCSVLEGPFHCNCKG